MRSNPSGLWSWFKTSLKQNPVAQFLPTWSGMCWRPSSIFHTGKSGEFRLLATWNGTRCWEVYMRRRCSQCTLAGNESLTSMKVGFLMLISIRRDGKDEAYGTQRQIKLSVRRSTSSRQCLQMEKFGLHSRHATLIPMCWCCSWVIWRKHSLKSHPTSDTALKTCFAI